MKIKMDYVAVGRFFVRVVLFWGVLQHCHALRLDEASLKRLAEAVRIQEKLLAPYVCPENPAPAVLKGFLGCDLTPNNFEPKLDVIGEKDALIFLLSYREDVIDWVGENVPAKTNIVGTVDVPEMEKEVARKGLHIASGMIATCTERAGSEMEYLKGDASVFRKLMYVEEEIRPIIFPPTSECIASTLNAVQKFLEYAAAEGQVFFYWQKEEK